MNGRIELHTESRYSENLSFLFGDDIAQKAKSFSCAAVAITDLNSVHTYAEAENVLSKSNIPMIYGITLSCADEEDRYDVVLLAKNLVGRDNIFRLTELLHENNPLLGHAVTRKQLDMHREGTLMGSAAFNGQLVRAILRRRNQHYLDLIAADYDYIEFTPEPYDSSAEIFRLAQTHKIPLCAVQHAVLSEEGSPAEYHAYRALNKYYLTDMKPAYWKPASELEEEIGALYVLPHEEDLAQQAVFAAPQKIAEQIEPMPPVCDIFETGQADWHKELMPELRKAAETTLRDRFGVNCPTAIHSRIEQELALIDECRAAPVFLYLSTLAGAVSEGQAPIMILGAAANSEILHLWGLSAPDPMPRHIWCPECGHWEAVESPLGTKLQCLHCGQTVTASGIDLPAESLRGLLRNGGSFELRGSSKARTFMQAKLREFKPAIILQVQLCASDGADSVESDIKIAEDYLQENPEISGGLRENGSFLYHIAMRKPCGDETGPPYCWYLCPSKNRRLLPHLPTYQIGESTYRLLFRADHWAAVPRIMPLAHTGLDLLAACEAAAGSPAAQIPLYSGEIYDAISSAVNDSAANGSVVDRVCHLFGLSPHYDAEFPFDSAPQQDFLGSVFRSMPLCGYKDLYRIMNLSHSAGAWWDNAEGLLERGDIVPAQVITCREDILDYLTDRGCDQKTAFEIMEWVRKGEASSKHRKFLDACFLPPQWEALRACGAEDWFINSCLKIGYLFPRGHGAAMADCLARLVWYAIHSSKETERVFANI